MASPGPRRMASIASLNRSVQQSQRKSSGASESVFDAQPVRSYKRTPQNSGVVLTEADIDQALKFWGISDDEAKNLWNVFGTHDKMNVAAAMAPDEPPGQRGPSSPPRTPHTPHRPHTPHTPHAPHTPQTAHSPRTPRTPRTPRSSVRPASSAVRSSLPHGDAASLLGTDGGPMMRKYRLFYPTTRIEDLRDPLRVFCLTASQMKSLLLSADVQALGDMPSVDPVAECFEAFKAHPDDSSLTPERVRAILEAVYPDLGKITAMDMNVLFKLAEFVWWRCVELMLLLLRRGGGCLRVRSHFSCVCGMCTCVCVVFRAPCSVNRDSQIDLFDMRHMLAPELHVVNAIGLGRTVAEAMHPTMRPSASRRALRLRVPAS